MPLTSTTELAVIANDLHMASSVNKLERIQRQTVQFITEEYKSNRRMRLKHAEHSRTTRHKENTN